MTRALTVVVMLAVVAAITPATPAGAATERRPDRADRGHQADRADRRDDADGADRRDEAERAHRADSTERAGEAGRRSTVIVSTSGIPHHDIGDLRRSRFWRDGMRNGISQEWRDALDVTLGQIASEQPDAVLHTGDMVAGRWGVDPRGTGIFGPVRTFAQRQRAVRRAAALYYPQHKRWWAAHGLRPHFGIGDHEMGDLPPSGRLGPDTFEHRALPAWRESWARAFTDGGERYHLHPRTGQHRRTAYATMLDGKVGLVTLDPFMRGDDGTRAHISRTQLRWMRGAVRTLRKRGARFVLVQCETPARGPNRQSHSSRLVLENGHKLWKALVAADVDLLLTSEFHEMTTHSDRGTTPVQVVHGGQMYRGSVNYLVITVAGDRLELELKRMAGKRTKRRKLTTVHRLRPTSGVRIYRGAQVVGTMTIHRDGTLSQRTGFLTEGYECSRPTAGPRCAAVHHVTRGQARATAPHARLGTPHAPGSGASAPAPASGTSRAASTPAQRPAAREMSALDVLLSCRIPAVLQLPLHGCTIG